MSFWDVAEHIVEDAIETGETIVVQGAEILGFIEGFTPGLIEAGYHLLLHEIDGDDDNGDGGGQARMPNTQVDSAQLILAEMIGHAYGETNDIITVPDAVTANLARAWTSVAPENWSTAWSLVIDSLGSVDEASTYAEGTLPEADYATTLSDAVPTEAATSFEPGTDTFLFTVHEASTSVWTSAFLH